LLSYGGGRASDVHSPSVSLSANDIGIAFIERKLGVNVSSYGKVI